MTKPFLSLRAVLAALCLALALAVPASAQPLQKAAILVDPGSPPSKQIGAAFAYRLTYNCASTSGPCLGAQVVDLLPPEVSYISTVPASATGDVAAVTVTPNFGGSGRTRVLFDMISPLPAGNSGDLIINVRFPNGTTPDGTLATNTADGINLQTTPGTFTTPPVTVRAVGAMQATLSKTLTSSPANLDLPETYRLRISNPNTSGTLNLTAIGPVVDTLPPGTVFTGATPAADCEPGCVGTTPATLTWTAPCAVPLAPNNNCDIFVGVVFPSATFPSGTSVTNSFVTDVTPLGGTPTGIGPGSVTHTVTTFVPNPSASQSKGFTSQPQPPALDMDFVWNLGVGNNGNVPLDNFTNTDTLPPQVSVTSVTTGSYTTAPTTVTVTYEKNTALGIFTLWGSSPGGTNATLSAPPPGLGVGEYITRIRWDYGTVQPGFSGTARINAHVINPDQLGNPVNTGDLVTNCVALDAVFTAGPTNVTRNNCHSFNISGAFTRSSPTKLNLSGAGPFGVNDPINWELRANNENFGTGSQPIVGLVVVDLLPLNLVYQAGTQACIDATCTALVPTFEEIPNYDSTGRTLLRWTFANDLLPGEDVRIGYQTRVRAGAGSGSLTNVVGQSFPPTAIAQRCANSTTDINDLDGDGSRADTLCTATATANIAAIAQLISSKEVQSVCDPVFGTSSNGTLVGASLRYKLRVQNVGTVAMTDFVLVDILPTIGDTGVIDTNPRLSQWTPLLVAPIIPPAGTTLFYSNSPNPCRGEVGGPTTSCDPPNWTTVPPTPISNARSVKIEFGNRVVSPFDTVEFTFQLTAPGSALSGENVFNSFGYLAARGDGLGNLSAEPLKVGTAIGSCLAATLGDFVWVDTDGDGQQNDGPTGVNGVFVELFTPGVDGIPHTLDDVPVGGTITADDPGGDPGWYRFGTLAPGDYYVCFHPPATYGITTPDVGSDSTDSDGDGNICTPVTNLSAGEDDPTLDLGLLPPVPAALGNYVWFDSNSDGVQNEPTTNGVNGVTVRLWADDFDGIREPNTGDVLVATAVTGDDIYGQPGYYLFPNLIPGQPYFVQFVLPPAATTFTTQDAGGNDATDSDADVGTGLTPIVTLASAEINLTIDAGLFRPAGTLALGDQVWLDTNNNGVFEPQNGEVGIDGVDLSLYIDSNGDGLPTLGEYVDATTTFTTSGFAGRYRFSNLTPGNYIVVVDASNFAGGGALSGLVTSTGNDPAPDPDDDVNGDDNGSNGTGAVVVSRPITMASPEPTNEDGDNTTNLTVDFGFLASASAPLLEYDYGDDPDNGFGTGQGNYQTVALDVGAYHRVGVAGAPFLGSCVDADSGSFNNLAATADDLVGWGLTVGTCAVSGDDEDGVALPSSLLLGAAVNIPVTAAGGTNDCVLNAFFDWNADGDFLDALEQVATDQVIPSGSTQNVAINVPVTASPGVIYTRFRCSSVGGLSSTGAAADGEVEDYAISIAAADLGDAPDSYGTLLPAGARHTINPSNALYLGACVDFEADGQPGATTTGDDVNAGSGRVGLCADDEDGIVFAASPIVACSNLGITVTASGAGFVSAWADWNGNGTFGDPGEMILNGTAVTTGANAQAVAVPCSAQPGNVYFRFRIADAPIALSDGTIAGGEVEDYVMPLIGNDLGDLPNSYGTSLATFGPRHAVDSAVSFRLGACVDTEGDGQPTAGATGDDVGAGTGTQGTCATGGDDEDGVSFASPALIACNNTSLTVNASAGGGFLNAWIDFNSDGDFGDAGEQIATGLALVAGNNLLAVATPCSALPALTGARFRFSSVSNLGPTDPTTGAPDGEVEDYVVQILGVDFGDLPDTFQTTFGVGGAQHIVDPAAPLHLGVCVDTETDGAPSAGANGDDLTAGTSSVGTCGGTDDENGVTLPAVFPACLARNVTVTLPAGQSGLLDAFIDWNQNGVFDLPAEQIADDLAVVAGANVISVTAPCSAAPGQAGARFRLSPTGVAGPAGVAVGGEVEDYLVPVEAYDYGDAPDSYGTTVASNGPNHTIDPANPLRLGLCVDTEADASAPLDATGDDGNTGNLVFGACAVAGDDEDGVDFSGGLVACQNRAVAITTSAAGRLDAWIDWNLDGDFLDAGEQVATNQAVPAGASVLNVAVPCALANGSTYSRFRLSPTGGLAPTGGTFGGEVEDHPVILRNTDFGDAPDTYGTTLAANGASHGIVSGFSLGATVDAEIDGQPSGDALGDGADEDGVVLSSNVLTACESITATVELTNSAGITGPQLDAWVDFDNDGTFDDPRDRIAAATVLTAGANAVVFTVPCDIPLREQTYARFRLSGSGSPTPTGGVVNGEVEDYAVVVEQPLIGVAKEAVSVERAGDDPTKFLVLYRFRVENFSVVPVNNFQLEEDLSTTYALAVSYTIDSVTSSDFTVNPAYDGAGNNNLLDIGNVLSPLGTGVVELVVRVDPGTLSGPYENSVTASGDTPGGVQVIDVSVDGEDPDENGNQNPNDDTTPTVVNFPIAVVEVPTLGDLGRLLLMLVLGLAAIRALRAR